MASSKQNASLTLADETFGERLHRAYRQGRAKYGYSYASVAEKVSHFAPTSYNTLARLELELRDISRASLKQRTVVFLALIAYGFNPEDFGLTEDMISLHPQVVKVAKRELRPQIIVSSPPFRDMSRGFDGKVQVSGLSRYSAKA